MNYKKRRQQLRKLLGDADGMLVTNETNVRYLSGFTGDSSYLLVMKGGDDAAVIVSDPRYEEQIEEQCPGLATHIRKPSEMLIPVTCQKIADLGIGKLLFEAASISYQVYESLKTSLDCELGKSEGCVEQLRAIKDKDEITVLRRAVAIAQKAFESMLARLNAKMTERSFAFELEHCMRELGAEGCAFAPIVAVGPRAALPHAEPGTSQIGDSPFVLVDWGACVTGYRSDLTRLIFTSKIPAKFSRAYEAVLAAQMAAIDAMKPGVKGSELDQIVRDLLRSAGVEKRFTHGLGHGIGLDIHESPRMGKNFDQPLQAGMVVTVEPGVYFPELGGIRIEDDVLITKSGAEVLSSLGKDRESCTLELI